MLRKFFWCQKKWPARWWNTLAVLFAFVGMCLAKVESSTGSLSKCGIAHSSVCGDESIIFHRLHAQKHARRRWLANWALEVSWRDRKSTHRQCLGILLVQTLAAAIAEFPRTLSGGPLHRTGFDIRPLAELCSPKNLYSIGEMLTM
jgi:hypothetical protein